MLPNSSLVFGGGSFHRWVTAADSIGLGVANATQHTRVLESDYVAFAHPLQYGDTKKALHSRTGAFTKTTNLQGETLFSSKSVMLRPSPSAGFPLRTPP